MQFALNRGTGISFWQTRPDNVKDMIQSQEELPGTHHPQRKIARELGVSQSSVSRLAHKLTLTNEFEFPEEMKK